MILPVMNLNRRLKLTANDLDLLFTKISKDKLSITQINLISILKGKGMSLKEALKEVDLYEVSRLTFISLKTELSEAQKKEKIFGKQAFFSKIVKDKYDNLIF